MPPLRRVLGAYRRALFACLPEARSVEIIAALLDHTLYQGRLPVGPIHASYSRYLTYLRTSGALYDPLRQFITDKDYAKLYIAAKVGGRYNVPTLLTTASLEEACAFNRDEDVIVKPTHMAAEVRLLKAGETLPHDLANRWLSTRYYRRCRESNYRYLKPRLIFEPCLRDRGGAPTEYKVFCFFGAPKFLAALVIGPGSRTANFYGRDWKPLNFQMRLPRGPAVERVKELEEMCWVAEQLSAPFDAIRVDLYSCDGRVYVGELTNCHDGARTTFSPVSADEMVGVFLRNPDLTAQEAFAALR